MSIELKLQCASCVLCEVISSSSALVVNCRVKSDCTTLNSDYCTHSIPIMNLDRAMLLLSLFKMLKEWRVINDVESMD